LIVIGSVQHGEVQVNYWTDTDSSYYGKNAFLTILCYSPSGDDPQEDFSQI
jgi:hypothetical protein